MGSPKKKTPGFFGIYLGFWALVFVQRQTVHWFADSQVCSDCEEPATTADFVVESSQVIAGSMHSRKLNWTKPRCALGFRVLKLCDTKICLFWWKTTVVDNTTDQNHHCKNVVSMHNTTTIVRISSPKKCMNALIIAALMTICTWWRWYPSPVCQKFLSCPTMRMLSYPSLPLKVLLVRSLAYQCVFFIRLTIKLWHTVCLNVLCGYVCCFWTTNYVYDTGCGV